MNIAKEVVSPKKAMQWLKRNIANRPLWATTVNQYAKAMADGAWKLNGDCIRFNGNGDLIDGQHRLTASVKSGESFETYVVRGLDHEAFDTIDQGKKRTTADVFARDGYKSYTTLASAVRWLAKYNRGMTTRHEPLRPDVAHAILDDNPNIHHAVDLALRLHRQQHLVHPGLLSFLIHETSRKHDGIAEVFWTSVITGEGLSKGEPAHLLNKRLVANYGAVAKLNAETIAALCIKAWNCHLSERPCGVLKWSEGEDFPAISHQLGK